MDHVRGVPVLTGKDNWTNWKFLIRAQLMDKDYALDVIDGIIPPPQLQAPRAETAEQLAARNEQIAHFNTGNRNAMPVLTRYLDDSIVSQIIGCNNARDVWRVLTELFDGATAADKAELNSEFHHFSQPGNETLPDIVQRFHSLIH